MYANRVMQFYMVIKALLFALVVSLIPAMAHAQSINGGQSADSPRLVFQRVQGALAASVPQVTCEPLIPAHTAQLATQYNDPDSTYIFLPIAVHGQMCFEMPPGSEVIDLGGLFDAVVTQMEIYRYGSLSTVSFDPPTATTEQLMAIMTRSSLPSNAIWKLIHAQPFTPSAATNGASILPELPSSWVEKYLGEILHYVDNLPQDVVVSFPTSAPVNNIPSLIGASSLANRCPAIAGRAGIGGIVEGFFWMPLENSWMVVVQWLDQTMLSACPWMSEVIFVPGSIAATNLPVNIRRDAEAYADLAARDWEFSAPIIPRPGAIPALGVVTIATVGVGVGVVAVFARVVGGGGGGSVGGGLYVFGMAADNPDVR